MGETIIDYNVQLVRQVFEEILPKYGYVIRGGQIELAEQMVMTLQNCGISLCEAEIGIGKTHAYIIAAILNSLNNKNFNRIRTSYSINDESYRATKMPTVISTSSIALQKAIAFDYIPEISKILMNHGLIETSMTSVVRKGKEHYVCDKRLVDYLKNVSLKENTEKIDIDEEQQLKQLQNANYRNIDLDMCESISNYVMSRICVPAQCNSRCDMSLVCRYNKLVKYSKSYSHDFQICNHNYFIADTRHRSRGLAPLIPNYQAVVIDEAHKFIAAARQMYGNEISRDDLRKQVHYIEKMRFKWEHVQESVESYSSRLLKLNKNLFDELIKPVLECEAEDDTERYGTDITHIALKTIKSIVYILKSLTQILGDKSCFKGNPKSIHQYVLRCLDELSQKFTIYLNCKSIVYWLEIPTGSIRDEAGRKVILPHGISLCSIPKDLNHFLYKDLWYRPVPMILTSGTLSVNGCFSHIKKNMGMDMIRSGRLDETSKESPFNYEENCLLYISNNTPFPDNKDLKYIKAVSSEVERLIMAAHGHTVVLFTSYRVMELVYNRLTGRISQYPIIKMGKGFINPINTFKKSKNGVLMASGNCWEGIDIPGDILSSLIIVKLPFAVPDPISKYEQTLYENIDEYKNKVVFPEMIIKFKQGVGRLIRSETDTGVISILDSRLKVGGNYRDRVLNALPHCRVTSSLDDVERFIKKKKDKSYFDGE